MCGRFNQVKLDQDEDYKKWNAKLTRMRRSKAANISAGMLAVAINYEGYFEAEFGFRPAWDTKKLFINARAEGKDNESNAPDGWNVGIDGMASFKKSFLNTRCIIPVDSFIEGPEKEKLARPFLIRTEDSKTLYLGAVYNQYKKADGEMEFSFAIITTPANSICRKIGHHRSPMLIRKDMISDWVRPDQDPAFVKQMVMMGYDEPNFVAIPLDPARVRSGKDHEPEVLEPFGEVLTVE